MSRISLAVDLHVFGKAFRPALADASRLGVAGVQFDAVGELSPAGLGGTARRELRTLLRSYNLQAAAVNCPLRYGLDQANDLEARLSRIRDAMDLAYDVGAHRVVVPMPRLYADATTPAAVLARESLLNLGAYGDRVGTLVGLEVGIDPAERVRDYLAGLPHESLGFTYDPANLLLNGHDPIASLPALGQRVVYCQARDARRATVSGGAREVPVGSGDIEWMLLVATLASINYTGYLCVEREAVASRAQDAASGVAFLRRFVNG